MSILKRIILALVVVVVPPILILGVATFGASTDCRAEGILCAGLGAIEGRVVLVIGLLYAALAGVFFIRRDPIVGSIGAMLAVICFGLRFFGSR